VGPRFGLGFHRAGSLRGAFVFDAERPGLKDGLALPWPSGRLVDAEAVFDGPNCWLFLAEETGGRTVHHCVVVGADGAVKASAKTEAGDGSWLGSLRGKCAAGEALFAATDAGLVRVELRQGQLAVVREFPDTEPFVDADSRLFLTRHGLTVVRRQDVTALRMT
jgi:CRP-like cAMP-binding protein